MTVENVFENKPNLHDMRNFRLVVDKVRCTPGSKEELLTKADDLTTGLKNTYSRLYPFENGDKLEKRLEILIMELVPEGELKESLEIGFKKSKERVGQESHGDVYVSEWKTIQDNVVIGIKTIQDQRGESVRTWYLRNTSKKPSIFSFLKK